MGTSPLRAELVCDLANDQITVEKLVHRIIMRYNQGDFNQRDEDLRSQDYVCVADNSRAVYTSCEKPVDIQAITPLNISNYLNLRSSMSFRDLDDLAVNGKPRRVQGFPIDGTAVFAKRDISGYFLSIRLQYREQNIAGSFIADYRVPMNCKASFQQTSGRKQQ